MVQWYKMLCTSGPAHRNNWAPEMMSPGQITHINDGHCSFSLSFTPGDAGSVTSATCIFAGYLLPIICLFGLAGSNFPEAG